jgi:hypothetical protein
MALRLKVGVPLGIHFPAFSPEQHLDTPLAVAHPRLVDLRDAALERGLIVVMRSIAIAGPLGLQGAVGPADADVPDCP